MRSLFIICAMVLALADASAAAGPGDDSPRVTPILELLKKNIFEVEQDFFVYHYQSALWIKRLDAIGFLYGKYLASKMSWGIPSSDVVGPGLYVGVDPIQTQNFGGAFPGVLIFKIKKGTKLLNLEAISPVTQPLQAALNAANCEGYYPNDELRLTEIFWDTRPAECLRSIRRVAKSLGVQGLYYDYQMTYEKVLFGDECRRLDGSINILNPSAVVWDEFEAFAQDSPPARWNFLKSGRIESFDQLDEIYRKKVQWLKPHTLGCQEQSKKLPFR